MAFNAVRSSELAYVQPTAVDIPLRDGGYFLRTEPQHQEA